MTKQKIRTKHLNIFSSALGYEKIWVNTDRPHLLPNMTKNRNKATTSP